MKTLNIDELEVLKMKLYQSVQSGPELERVIETVFYLYELGAFKKEIIPLIKDFLEEAEA